MTLFKSSFWMTISTSIKAMLTYIMWKVIAVKVGPSGVGIIEQFQNFIQVSRVSIPAGINEGIVKFSSEYRDNEIKKADVLSNAMFLNFIIFIIVFFALIFFSREFSYLIFQTTEYRKMIIMVAIGILLFIINNFCLSMLNAEMEIKKYFLCTVLGTVFNFILTATLAVRFGLSGALIGFAFNQTFIGILTAYLVIKSHWFKFQLFFSKINFSCIKKLIAYSCIPFSAALIGPIAVIFVTKYIATSLTWADVGYWQAIARLSSGYLIIMAMIFGFYFIPRFSSLQKKTELKAEVIKIHYYIFPLILLGAVLVFVLKKQIVIVMYSKEFLPVVPLFKYQLIGDISRTSTWLLKNILAAKAMVKTCVTMEMIFTILYVCLTILFVHYDGLIGTAIAFAINYSLYWITMIIFSKIYLNKQDVINA